MSIIHILDRRDFNLYLPKSELKQKSVWYHVKRNKKQNQHFQHHKQDPRFNQLCNRIL